MVQLPIYVDNHATTPVDPRVLEAMLPYFGAKFGNAASRHHAFGWEAQAAVDRARQAVADLIGADSKEIILTSGATESDNLAIKGAAWMDRNEGNHIITSCVEHKAVLDTCRRLEREGFEVTYLPVDRYAMIDPEAVREAIRPNTILITIMAANNEVGTTYPIERIGAIAKEKGVLFHCDATQAVGKIPIDVERMGIDMLSLSAHKMYGPKGIGALYVRRKNPRVKLSPILDGGGHERGLRPGTINVPGAVGLGEACRIARDEMAAEAKRLKELRTRLHQGITSRLEGVHLNGHPEERLPGSLNLSFAWIEGEALMMGIKEIAVSSGSACTSASLEPSYVLKAMGVGGDLAHSSIRFGLGRFNTEEEVDYTIEKVVEATVRLRELSPLYELAKEGKSGSAVWSDRDR